MEVQNGQIWWFKKNFHYLVSNVALDSCSIQKVRRQDDKWVEFDNCTNHYALAHFEGKDWEYLEGGPKECPECNKSTTIPDDDFLCKDCRQNIPMECRLVADIKQSAVIVTLSGTKEYIKLTYQNAGEIVIRREDLPQVALVALREFLDVK
jgi:hypothetical protein